MLVELGIGLSVDSHFFGIFFIMSSTNHGQGFVLFILYYIRLEYVDRVGRREEEYVWLVWEKGRGRSGWKDRPGARRGRGGRC